MARKYPEVPKKKKHWLQRDITVGIVTGLWAGRPKNRGSITGMGNRFFIFHKAPSPALGPNRLVSGFQMIIAVAIKRSGREADYSLPLTTEVKNVWRCTSIPSLSFMSCTVTTLPFTDWRRLRTKRWVFENKKTGNTNSDVLYIDWVIEEIWRRQKNYTINHNNVSSRLQWNTAGRIVKENVPRRTHSLYSVNSRPMYL
jgi:hypothetical protein